VNWSGVGWRKGGELEWSEGKEVNWSGVGWREGGELKWSGVEGTEGKLEWNEVDGGELN